MQLKQKLQIDVSASKSQKKWTWAYVTSDKPNLPLLLRRFT